MSEEVQRPPEGKTRRRPTRANSHRGSQASHPVVDLCGAGGPCTVLRLSDICSRTERPVCIRRYISALPYSRLSCEAERLDTGSAADAHVELLAQLPGIGSSIWVSRHQRPDSPAERLPGVSDRAEAAERETLDWLLPAFRGRGFPVDPIQTEAVAYIAGRSETLSVFFFLSAFAVFLFRKDRRSPGKSPPRCYCCSAPRWPPRNTRRFRPRCCC